MPLSQSNQVSSSQGLRTLRHTSTKGDRLDLRTRYKRDGELVRGIAPVVERSEHDASVKGDTILRLPHHNTRDPLPSSQLTRPLGPLHAPAPTSASRLQESEAISVPLPQSPYTSSPGSNANAPSSHSPVPTKPTYFTSSSTSTSTSSCPLTLSSSSRPSGSLPPTTVNYDLEPFGVDHITRPTPEETAEVIDPAGFRHILDLPKPISRIDSAVSSLRGFGSWMSLRKYGSQGSLYWQDRLD